MLLSQETEEKGKKKNKKKKRKGNNKRRSKTKKGNISNKTKKGFKIVKMAVQIFDVFEVFWGNLRPKFANFVGTKNTYFCRKEAKVAQRSTLFWFMLTFELPKSVYFCRTEHVVAQRST